MRRERLEKEMVVKEMKEKEHHRRVLLSYVGLLVSSIFDTVVMLILFHRMRSLLKSVRCSTFLKTTKQWLKLSSKAEVRQ